MTRFFELVMLLYPLSIRYEFGEEMRLVFLAGLPPAGASRLRYLSREFAGLIRGAI